MSFCVSCNFAFHVIWRFMSFGVSCHLAFHVICNVHREVEASEGQFASRLTARRVEEVNTSLNKSWSTGAVEAIANNQAEGVRVAGVTFARVGQLGCGCGCSCSCGCGRLGCRGSCPIAEWLTGASRGSHPIETDVGGRIGTGISESIVETSSKYEEADLIRNPNSRHWQGYRRPL